MEKKIKEMPGTPGNSANAERKYTYEELSGICDNLARENMQMKNENGRLSSMLEQAREMLDSLQTQNLFAYIGALNKIMDNAPLFRQDFVDSTASSIEEIMGRLHELFLSNGEPEDDGKDAPSE